MTDLEKRFHNMCLPQVDTHLYMLFTPGWYDAFTGDRLLYQTEYSTFCRTGFELLSLKAEISITEQLHF